MKNRTLTMTLVGTLAVAIAPLGALAQNGPDGERGHGRGHRGVGRLMRVLDLTEEQRASLKQFRQEQQAARQPLREEARSVRKQLRAALQSGQHDAAAIGELAIKAHDLEQQTKAARQEMKQHLLSLLTAEQLETYNVLEKLRKNKRGRHGSRGGPRGPLGGPGDVPEIQ